MKQRLYPLLLTALLIALPSGWATADTGEITLDKVIVSARGTDSTQSQTPGGTGVVDREDIELMPTASLADSLMRISGLTKSGESPWGQDISIRGMTGASVVVLIDGMRVNTATEINARLGFINPMDVERIEVLKGPVSSLYGSGSTGGVINIITKKGDYAPAPEMGGEMIGSWRSNPQGPDGYLRANFSSQDLWLQASGAIRDHDDLWGGDDTRITNSAYEDNSIRLAGEKTWADRLITRFQVMNLEASEIGIPGGSSTMPATADITYPRTRNSMVSLDTSYKPESALFESVDLNLYYMKNERRVRIDKPTPAIKDIRPSANHETVGGKFQALMDLGDHSVIAGVDAYNWHMVSKRLRRLNTGVVLTDHPTPNTTQLSMGVFAEDDWRLTDRFTLNLGARLDQNTVDNKANEYFGSGSTSDIGWNMHAGLTWAPAEHWSHTLIVASSYRAADIVERFKHITLGGGITALGNPELDPETSYYAEYGLHYATQTFSASGGAYINYITDYIDDKLLNATTYQMENIGQARIMGLEMDMDWQVAAQWSLYGNLALANGRDLEANEALRNVAPVNGMAGVRYDMGNGFWARLESPWALRQSETPSGIDRTNGWATLNAATGYGFDWAETRNEITLAVDNVFDTKYENYLANSRGIQLLEPGLSAAITYKIAF